LYFIVSNVSLKLSEYRDIPINEAETDPLIGISLLYGYDLHIQTVEGGNVTIKLLE
jgi:hypothetical protein